MTKSRGINAPKTKWTADMDEAVRSRYPNEKAAVLAASLGVPLPALYSRAKRLGVPKSAEFFSTPESGRLDGVKGAKTRFTKGNVPWTKGKTGLQLGVATQFKPGTRPHNYMQIGSRKMHTGYHWIKVRDGGWPEAWRPEHHVIWEQHNGKPIPAGHVVSFRDRNRDNLNPANFELISKADWLKRHTLHNLPPVLKQLMWLRAALVRQINSRTSESA